MNDLGGLTKADLPTMPKGWSGPVALIALGAWIAVQVTGVVKTPAPEEMTEGARREIEALKGRLDDHDGRIARSFAASREERDAREDYQKEANQRLRDVEFVAGRLTDRLDDQRANLAAFQATLTSMNSTLSKMEREQAVIAERVSALARRAGVDRPPPGAR